jgi:protein-disulfide isomerase
VKDYPEDVRIVFKMHPLEFHPNAPLAAQAAMAAKAQGKFFEMNKKLLSNQGALTRDNMLLWAKEMGLDVERFTKDMDSETTKADIARQTKEVTDIGASGTPASFVNGRYLSGAKPYSAFKDIIDEELKWAKDGKRPEFKTARNVSEASPAPARPTGPDPNKAYTIPLGDAPVIGPATAKVLIQHYLDYQ